METNLIINNFNNKIVHISDKDNNYNIFLSDLNNFIRYILLISTILLIWYYNSIILLLYNSNFLFCFTLLLIFTIMGLICQIVIKLYNTVGIYYYYNGDYNNAEKYFLLGAKEDNSDCLNNLGIIYTYIKKDYAKSIEYYLKAIKFNRPIDKSININNNLNNYKINLGISYYYNKNFIDAIDIFENLLKISNYDEINVNLGNIYYNDNNLIKAEECNLKALKLNNNFYALINLGKIYINHKNNIDIEINNLKKSIKLNNDYAKYSLECYYLKNNNYIESKKYLLMATIVIKQDLRKK